MVFKDGCALDLAQPLWRVSGLAACRRGCCGVVWEPAPSGVGALSSRLCAVHTGSSSWSWVTRQWDSQTIVGTPTSVSSRALRWFTALSVLVATRESWWWEKFFLGTCGHGVCARGRGLPGHAASPRT